MGCLCCKQCYGVEEERKPLLEGDRSAVQHEDQTPDPMKDDDGTLPAIHENTAETKQKLSSQFQSEVGYRIESSPSSQQLLVSVQDKSAAFLPDSNAVTHTSSQFVAQVPASEDEPQNAAVGIEAPPEAGHVNSAVNSNTLTPTLPDSSSTEAISTTEKCVPNEDEQTGLSLTTPGNITLDLEQKDTNGFSTELVTTEGESRQPLDSEQPTENTLQSLSLTDESSAVCHPRDNNSDFGNSTGLLSPIASTDHQRSSTRDAQTVNQTTNYTGDTQNDAKISSLASEILVVEAENQTATYTGDAQNDAEILVVEAENQTTTYTGDAQNDAEILVVEAENQTTTYTGDTQNDAEILVVEAENQTTTYTGDTQNDAEILVVEAGNQTTTYTGDTQSDAEILVVEAENQATTYTGDTQNDAETLAVEGETQATTYAGDMQNDAEIPLLEAENETTAASTCTRDKLRDTEISMIETEHRTTTTSHTEGTQNDADISMFETENTSASAPVISQSDAEASVVETGNHTTATSYTAATQVLEFSAYDAKSKATTTSTYAQGDAETPETGNQTSHTGETRNETDILMLDEVPATSTSGSSQGDTEISVVETENQSTTTSHAGDKQEDAEISMFEAETKATAASTSGSSQSDADTSVVETGKQTTYYNITQNVFEIDFSDRSPASKRRNIESVPLLQHSETNQAPEDYTDDAAKDLAASGANISLKKRWYGNFRARINHLNKPGSSLHREFATLMTRSGREVQYTSAQHHVNSSKNRPGAPLPPETSTRVKLQPLDWAEGFDYINGCYVGTPSHRRAYIVTQTPMGNTVGDFWRMVWEQGVSVIVLLTQKIEHLGGLSPKFWPKKGLTNHHGLVKSGNWIAGSLSVKTIKEVKHWNVKDLVTRHIELRSDDPVTCRTVEIYHYLGWPQRDIARSPKDVVYLLNQVIEGREYLPEEGQAECPVVVVSAHGAGRAGCLCAVAVAHELMTAREENPDCWTQDGHILDEVIQGLRECRGGLVEDRFQYEFCHQVLSEVLATSRIEPSPMKKRKGDTFEVKSKKKGQKQKGKHRMH